VFQWVGDHQTLFPHLVTQLRPGGALAVQMPRNFEAPTHTILRELARTPPWASRMSAREPYWVKTPSFYYDVLSPVSTTLDLWETEYQHVLPDHHAIVEWYKGTGLRPYLEALPPDEHPAFLEALEARLVEAYPRLADGRVLFPFLRLFFVAVR
jgi:trans-aconitate 2-methyltransferase